MVEFFQNIFNWFVENKEEIVLFFTSSNFVAFISAIVLFIRQIKANKAGTAVNKELNQSLLGVATVGADIVTLKETNDNTNTEVKKLENDLDRFNADITDTLDTVMAKLNAVIEVQSIVYSTLKDETIRQNVNGILTDAKYAETATRAALESEIEELKQKVNTKMEAVKEVVEVAAEKVHKVVSTKNKASRY